MTDLTEQWKSGELKQGWYYINSRDIDYAKDFAYHDPCCKCIAKIDYTIGE